MNVKFEDSIWAIDEDKAIKAVEQLEINENVCFDNYSTSHSICKSEEGFDCWHCVEGYEYLYKTHSTAELALNEVASWT